MSLQLKSFDETLDAFENGGEKQEKRNQQRIEKQEQLDKRIMDLSSKLNKKNLALKKSLTDPTQDTVQIALDIQVTEKELEVAKQIKEMLFPAKSNTVL